MCRIDVFVTGTRFVWEIMSMLLCDSAEYMEQPKLACMIDLLPMSTIEETFPAGKPKVVNTHYRLDVLPEQFKNRKTVLGMCYYNFLTSIWKKVVIVVIIEKMD